MGINYDLIVCDLDGTLLNNNKEISSYSVNILKKINQQVPIVFATARAPRDTKKFINLLAVNNPSINYNGAMIYSYSDKKSILNHTIAKDVALAIISEIKKTNLASNYLVEKEDQFWVDLIDQDVQSWIDMGCPPHAIGYPSKFLDNSLAKIMIKGDCEKIVTHIQSIFKDVIYTFSDSKRIWVEFLNKNSSKDQAFMWLAEYLNIPIERTIAFGDAENDIQLLKTAGLGVAMGNASNYVKEAANQITLSNEEDGVAVFLKNILI